MLKGSQSHSIDCLTHSLWRDRAEAIRRPHTTASALALYQSFVVLRYQFQGIHTVMVWLLGLPTAIWNRMWLWTTTPTVEWQVQACTFLLEYGGFDIPCDPVLLPSLDQGIWNHHLHKVSSRNGPCRALHKLREDN